MKPRIIPVVAVLTALLWTAKPARADTSSDSGLDGIGAIYLLGTTIDVGMIIGDVAVQPTSHLYGWVEVGVNVAPLILDFSFMAEGDGDDPLLWGVTAIHLLTASHGLYTILAHREPPALAFDHGSVHGKVAPTAVSDGKLALPGLGIVGTF